MGVLDDEYDECREFPPECYDDYDTNGDDGCPDPSDPNGNNLVFATGSLELSADSQRWLGFASFQAARLSPAARFHVQGSAAQDAQSALANSRANALAHELAEKGIPADQIVVLTAIVQPGVNPDAVRIEAHCPR